MWMNAEYWQETLWCFSAKFTDLFLSKLSFCLAVYYGNDFKVNLDNS